MKTKIIFLTLLFFNIQLLVAQKSKPDHSIFDKLLNKYVDVNGKVDYKSLLDSVHILDKYLNKLESFSPKKNWHRNETMAYWINAYNAYTIKMILNHYPTESITKLYEGEPWKYKWIKINGDTLSLDNIEHGILRSRYKDPRIHFAVNCASNSCPPLPRQAFTKRNLEKLLNQRATFFFNSQANEISSESMKLSKILDWYKEDFGDIYTFVSKYSKVKPNKNATIAYLDYDWALNGQK